VSGFLLHYIRASDPSAGSWAFTRRNTDQKGAASTTVTSPGSTPVGHWAHVAGVYDADASVMSLYVDGVLQKAAPFPAARAFPVNRAFTIGYGKWDGVVANRLNGAVRDVRAYNQPLT